MVVTNNKARHSMRAYHLYAMFAMLAVCRTHICFLCSAPQHANRSEDGWLLTSIRICVAFAASCSRGRREKRLRAHAITSAVRETFHLFLLGSCCSTRNCWPLSWERINFVSRESPLSARAKCMRHIADTRKMVNHLKACIKP